MDERQLPAVHWEGFSRLPDKGAMQYVRDILSALGVDVEHIEQNRPHWMPAGIVGTLDWVMICGWWIYRHTGIYNSDAGYLKVIRFGECELDPDIFIVFEEDASRNSFNTRLDNPGIEGKERGEALQFLRKDVYEQWALEAGADPEEFNPPQQFLELVMWGTFMWVLSKYGRDWVYMQDPISACVIDYGVAFLEKFPEEGRPGELFDPTALTITDRPIATCKYCEERLWCVRGAFIDGDKWQFVCINCLVERWENGEVVDTSDERILRPKCPHKEGIRGSTKSCVQTCPHSKMNQEKVWERMEEAGSERLRQYRKQAALGGASPRRLAGQTIDDLVQHFRRREDE